MIKLHMSEEEDEEEMDILQLSDYMIKRFSKEKDDTLLEKYERFKHLCQYGKTKEEIFELAKNYVTLWKSFQFMMVKEIYNEFVGWALPSKRACTIALQTYHDHIKTYPDAKFIDFGAGSGIFSHVFHQMGIPKEKILAVDLPKPTHFADKQRKFWPLHQEENYEVDINDVLFVAWGHGCSHAVNSYSMRGGKCVIILGEVEGCTFTSDYFEDEHDWEVELHHVPGPASQYSEHISVNKRK